MFSKFRELDPAKQSRILNAALREFAQKGFDDASTIEIAKEAGISKGLLFHYFNTKKDLFRYLYDYSMETLSNEVFGLINFKERDMLKRARQIILLKIELLHKYPQMFDFIKVAVFTESEEVKGEFLSKSMEIRSGGLARLFEDIDESKFRPGIDVARAKNIIIWTLEGIGNASQEEAKEWTPDQVDQIDYDQVLAEYDAYFDLFRACFYGGA